MSLIREIPDSFWGLFRSCNREIYMEALLRINDEYEYSNYYLSREVCIQALNESFSQRSVALMRDEYEGELDVLEPMATRVLGWLLRTGWLRKVEDYNSLTTNIIIPDYAAVMIEAMEKLTTEEEDATQVYIQNVYAILFSLRHDPRANISLLDTALINTRKLNKALQDMLHNMDKFFGSLLEQRVYGELLRDHLEGYVQEVVQKKYHILKTSDNFYIYKADIKRWLGLMREDEEWLTGMCRRSLKRERGAVADGSGRLFGTQDWTDRYGAARDGATRDGEARDGAARDETVRDGAIRDRTQAGNSQKEPELERCRKTEADILEKLDLIERGFDDIEHRIANMDKEHSKYVRATVSRLNYLLNEDDDMKGLVIQLLNRLAAREDRETMITAISERMNLSQVDILSNQSLYKRRRRKADFQEGLGEEEVQEELSREELLDLNKIKKRYSKKQIEEFIGSRMKGGMFEVTSETVKEREDFEKLILAYDYSIRRKSLYRVLETGGTGSGSQVTASSSQGAGEEKQEQEGRYGHTAQPEMIESGGYRYPRLTFIRRHT